MHCVTLLASQAPWLTLETMLCLNCVFWLAGQNPMNFRNGDASFFRFFARLAQESPGTGGACARKTFSCSISLSAAPRFLYAAYFSWCFHAGQSSQEFDGAARAAKRRNKKFGPCMGTLSWRSRFAATKVHAIPKRRKKFETFNNICRRICICLCDIHIARFVSLESMFRVAYLTFRLASWRLPSPHL